MELNRPLLRTRRKPVGLDGLTLKYIGWVFTVAGTIATAFYPEDYIDTTKFLLVLVSYLAMPIFSFLVSEGVQHTSDIKSYILTTLVAAVIAEPFYDYARCGVWFDFFGQNALFSLVVCQIMVYFMMQNPGKGRVSSIFTGIVLTLAGTFWVVILQGQYGIYFVLMTAIFYQFRNHKVLRLGTAITLSIALYYTPEFSLIAINKYNGKRGSYHKLIFYILYPVMWIVAVVINLFFG